MINSNNNSLSGDQMKISKKILGTFAVLLTAACGVAVDQKEIHKINEGNSSQSLGEGFDLSGTDVSSLGSASNLNASSNLLECTPGAGGDGIVTNTVNYDLTAGEVTVRIDLTNTTSGHGEKISLISSTGDDYHFTIFDAGGYGYQAKASRNSGAFDWHRDFGVGNSVGYLRFKHDTTFNQMRLGFSTDGNFNDSIYMPYSVTSPTNFKLEFRCDDTLGSRISDLVINGDQLDLSLGGGTPPPSGSENVIWLKPADLASGAIANWGDTGGGATHNAYQNDTARQPTVAAGAINGIDAAQFDGSNDYLRFHDHAEINNGTGGPPYDGKAILIAFKTSSDVTNRQVIYEQGGGTRGLNIYIWNGLIYFNGWNKAETVWNPVYVSSSVQANTTYVATLRFSSTTGKIYGYLQGQLIGEATGAGLLYGHAYASLGGGGTLFHNNTTGTNYFNGQISEFVKYNSALSDTELQAVMDQLTNTYVVTVPSNYAFRLRGDQEVTSSSGSVSAWGDMSANNINATQGTASLQPDTSGTMNSNPGLYFDGSDKLIIANNGLLNVSGPYSQKTMSIAFRTSNDISSNQLLYEQGGGTRGLAVYISGGKVYFNIWNKANDGGTSASYFNPVYLSQNISPNTDYVVTGLYEFGGRKLEMRVNDSALITNTQGDTRFGQLYNHGADVSVGGSASVVLHNNTYVTNGMYFTGTIAEMVYYNTALSAADSLALHNSLKQKYGASGSSGGGGPSGPFTLNDATQNQYLAYVEAYIDSQTRTSNYGETRVRTYDVNASNYNLNGDPLITQPDQNGFYWATDTYDNALAVIFYSVIGKPTKAAAILDSWIRMQNWQINDDPDQYKKALFWARYRYDDNTQIWNIDSGGEFLDTGNNAMMALAMCRYYQQFKNDAPDAALHKNYYNAAKSIMTEIHSNFVCNEGSYNGYMGRPTSFYYNESGEWTPYAGYATWMSVEHNLDMYALGACMEDAALTAEPGVNTIADDVKTKAGLFVSQMWDAGEKAYKVGTGACGPSTGINDDYKPADGITWRHLSKAETSITNHNDRSADSMVTLVSSSGQFLVQDMGFTNLIGTPYWGTKFSDADWEGLDPAIGAYGAQQENTGAALIALNDYYGNTYNADLEKIRTGVKAMLSYYGDQNMGIPAHFEENISNCNSETRAYCNTGLQWSYQRVPHTAATVYFGLALLYQFSNGGTIIPGANPYYPTSSEVVLAPGESVPVPNH